MLYSSITDMENQIEDLKSKVLKTENRVKSVKARSHLLSDTNLEHNDVLNFLSVKTKSLEASLHQVDNAKIETTKKLGIIIKVIDDLVPNLTIEREQKKDSARATSRIPSGEVLTKSAARYQANKLSEDSPLLETKQDVVVRDIEAGQLNIKFLLGGVFILIVSVVAVYLFQEDKSPL
ncbi:hypothetical protein GIB67_023800 [Kingdonia uniflora]|uniref:Uncharacterized protein n=1 Tax=Kingdonia uniflora TaxID=39325 RepID=A0A7J7NGF7_9MAGN|nr:hypothetical protein GIB67_023800 [Kingdonia uniflora]